MEKKVATLSITRAKPADREWGAQVMVGSEPWITLGTTLEQARAVCSDPAYDMFIVRLARERSGMLILDMKGLASSPYIKVIAVEKLSRGREVGSKLIFFAENQCRERSRHLFLCVSSFNEGAIRFYRRHGFEQVGELKDYLIAGASELIMHKPL